MTANILKGLKQVDICKKFSFFCHFSLFFATNISNMFINEK